MNMLAIALISTTITLGMIANMIIQDLRLINTNLTIEQMRKLIDNDMDTIIERVSDVTGIPVERMKKRTRKQEVVIARQVACYIIKDVHRDKVRWHDISGKFNQDHSTAMHAVRTVTNMIKVNDKIVKKIIEMYGDTSTVN